MANNRSFHQGSPHYPPPPLPPLPPFQNAPLPPHSYPQQPPLIPQPTLDNNAWNTRHLPINAQSGLQYTALASLTSTDSVLRDLPSLSVSFPEFRLLHPTDPSVQTMLSQQGLSQHAINFQTAYISSLIANANVSNIRFQTASQITASKDSFVPRIDRPLSSLSEHVLHQCSQPSSEQFYSGNVHQLPRIDPFQTLIQFRNEATAASVPVVVTSQMPLLPVFPATAVPVVPVPVSGAVALPPVLATTEAPVMETPTTSIMQKPAQPVSTAEVNPSSPRNPSPPLASSQKRSAMDNLDDELDQDQRVTKKIKSRPSSAMVTIKLDPTNLSPALEIAPQQTSNKVAVGVLTPPSDTTPMTSAPATPVTQRQTQPTKDSDPVPEFEDSVCEILDSVINAEGASEDGLSYLSSLDLKRLARTIEDLSRRGILADVQEDTMSTLLKYLDATISHFDAIDLFPLELSRVVTDNEQDVVAELGRSFDRTIKALDHIALSLVLLNSQGVEQNLFPEELLISSVNVFRKFLDNFLAPALEFSKEDTGHAKGYTVFKTIAGNNALSPRVVSLVCITCELSEKLRKSGTAEVSDSIIVKLVYIALSLFFIDTTSDIMVGPTESLSLKQAGSSLLRMLFAKRPDQRPWILEEILSSLIKLPHGKKVSKAYRLNDGTRIHASSALLMQLVHTCAENSLSEKAPLDFQELPRPSQKAGLHKLVDGVKSAMESTKSSVSYIFNFLLSRCTKGTKSSVEADYRLVLDCLVTDLLAVLGEPEWPSAELFLFLHSNAMVRFLDDPKADLYSRTMAVDSLGQVAAKIKTISNQLAVQASEARKANPDKAVRPFQGEVDIDTGVSDLSYLRASYGSVMEYLGSNEMNDPAVKAANNSWICQWIWTICNAATKETGDQSWADESWAIVVEEAFKCWKLLLPHERSTKSKTTLSRKTVVNSSAYLTSRLQLFHSFDMLLSRILLTLEGSLVALRTKSLKALSLIVTGDYEVLAQQNVRKTIALRLQDASPAVRDAAIDLVGKYMLQDMTILKAYYELVSDRISDTGLNVRKRVIRLLRDIFYKAESPAVRNDISKKLLLRVNDDETTVKDLAIKCVNDIWFGQFIQATQVAQETSEDAPEESGRVGSVTSSQKRDVLKRARNLVDMVGNLSISQDEAFGSVIQNLLKKERDHGPFNITATGQDFTRTCSVIVECLVDLVLVLQEEEAPKSAVVSAVQALQTFVKSEPRLAKAKHLSALQEYLHSSTTSDDWRITMFVLKIYEDAIPVVRDVPLAFSQTGEKLVSALLSSCPMVLLPEAVHVLCGIVQLLTIQCTRLCKLVQSCVNLLKVDAQKLAHGAAIQENKTRRLMVIVGLLSKHFPFEQMIKESPQVPHLAELKTKMLPSVQDVVFETLVPFCDGKNSKALQHAAIQSLGYLFMSFPTFMNSAKSLAIMDSVFTGNDGDLKAELLLVYTNFLVKIQTTPASENSAGRSLIAKAEDHMDAGIGSSIMQRYLDRILQCALVVDRKLQSTAVDVISQVTAQALVHPMLCMPAIVALETSQDPLLSDRVRKIHKDLHQKHASLIYARSMECIRTAYLYQKRIQSRSMDIQGFRVTPETGSAASLLCLMYSLVSDKRQARNALLSAMVKVLDVDLTASTVEVDGNYSRFIAENLAYLEYRTMEEVYLVIYFLNRIIAGAGMTVFENLGEPSLDTMLARTRRPSNTLQTKKASNKGLPKVGSGRGRKGSKDAVQETEMNDAAMQQETNGSATVVVADEGEDSEDKEPTLPIRVVAKASVAVEIVVLLKGFLKKVYDISESKCQQFQPSAHASHKEKPSPRLTGVMARIQWHWKNAAEIEALCSGGSRGSLQGGESEGIVGEVGEDVLSRQAERFRELIEAETVQKGRDDEGLEEGGHPHPQQQQHQQAPPSQALLQPQQPPKPLQPKSRPKRAQTSTKKKDYSHSEESSSDEEEDAKDGDYGDFA